MDLGVPAHEREAEEEQRHELEVLADPAGPDAQAGPGRVEELDDDHGDEPEHQATERRQRELPVGDRRPQQRSPGDCRHEDIAGQRQRRAPGPELQIAVEQAQIEAERGQ